MATWWETKGSYKVRLDSAFLSTSSVSHAISLALHLFYSFFFDFFLRFPFLLNLFFLCDDVCYLTSNLEIFGKFWDGKVTYFFPMFIFWESMANNLLKIDQKSLKHITGLNRKFEIPHNPNPFPKNVFKKCLLLLLQKKINYSYLQVSESFQDFIKVSQVCDLDSNCFEETRSWKKRP